MKRIVLGIIVGVIYSLAWSQTAMSLPPLPPPLNPASVAIPGSPSFYIFYNNMMNAQSSVPAGSGLNVLGAQNMQGVSGLSTPSDRSISWQLPKSFESSIQGLQFIKANPSQ